MLAAALMTIGFWRRSAFVRWQALILIAVAIAKVFVYDAWGLQQAYKIVVGHAPAYGLIPVSTGLAETPKRNVEIPKFQGAIGDE